MKRKFQSIILFTAILICFFSCSDDGVSDTLDAIYDTNYSGIDDNSSNGSNSASVKLRINEAVYNEINKNRLNKVITGDSYLINFVKREGDFIQVNLSYSGGCKTHDFEIIWDGIVYTDNPCHMNLLLIQNGNGDSCEALIIDTVVIDLNALVGDVTYKDSCAYNIFSTYNSSDRADAIVKGKN